MKIAMGNSSEGQSNPPVGPNRKKPNLATWAREASRQRVKERDRTDDVNESAPPVAGGVINLSSIGSDVRPDEAVLSRNHGNRKNVSRTLAESLAGLSRPPLPRARKKEAMQRLAVDIPASLHATIKRVAGRPGGSLRDDVATLLDWYYQGK